MILQMYYYNYYLIPLCMLLIHKQHFSNVLYQYSYTKSDVAMHSDDHSMAETFYIQFLSAT